MNASPARAATGTGASPPPVLQLRSSAGLYGAERMLLALNAGLHGEGAASRLLSIHNPLIDTQPLHQAALDAGQDAALLPCRGRLDLRTVAALVEQVDRFGAGIVHAHDYKSAFYAWLAARRRPQLRLLATQHGWVETSQALRLYTRLELSLLRRFDALVVVSDAQVERLLHAGVSRARIHQIDNGIALPDAAATTPSARLRSELGLDGDGTVFAAVARLAPEKNLAMLLSAFAAVAAGDASARLLIVGDGPERAALEAQAARLRLRTQVRFAGVRDDMPRVYPLVDCLLLPSLSEGMPLTVLEAMAHGIPVIASAVGEIPRLLANSDHGRTLPPGDEPALRASMLSMLPRRGLRDPRAAAYVRARHSDAAMARGYLQLYRQPTMDRHERRTA